MFYRDCLIWSPWNAADLAAVFAGLFAASKVGPKSKRPRVWLALAVMSAFCEMLLFGMRVWNAQPRPDHSGDSPYPESAWAARFKSRLSDGSVVFRQNVSGGGRGDFDYMQINAPSACGIRQAEGYESVQPARLKPIDGNAFDPSDCALAGVSHVSCPHGQKFRNCENWELVEESDDYDLWANPEFKGAFAVRFLDGVEQALRPARESPNHVVLVLPAGTTRIRIARSWHRGWRYRLGDGNRPCGEPRHALFQVELPDGRFQFHSRSTTWFGVGKLRDFAYHVS